MQLYLKGKIYAKLEFFGQRQKNIWEKKIFGSFKNQLLLQKKPFLAVVEAFD